jgi:hypothetical protein
MARAPRAPDVRRFPNSHSPVAQGHRKTKLTGTVMNGALRTCFDRASAGDVRGRRCSRWGGFRVADAPGTALIGDAGKRVSQMDPLRALCGFESRLGNRM